MYKDKQMTPQQMAEVVETLFYQMEENFTPPQALAIIGTLFANLLFSFDVSQNLLNETLENIRDGVTKAQEKGVLDAKE